MDYAHRLAEERKPCAVVVAAIELAAHEIHVVLHKIIGHTPEHQPVQPAVQGLNGHIQGKIRQKLHLIPVLLGDGIVKGHHHADILPQFSHGLRKRIGYVAQSSVLGEGKRLADCIENIHIPPQTADSRLFSPQNTGKEPTDCILVCGFLQITPQRSGNSIQAVRRRAK